MKKMYDDESRDRQHPQRGGKDISPEAPGALEWTCQDPAESLKRLLQYVESEADKAIAWYRQRKNRKWSRANVKPGQYNVRVSSTSLAGAAAPAGAVADSTVVIVKPGEIAKGAMELPLP